MKRSKAQRRKRKEPGMSVADYQRLWEEQSRELAAWREKINRERARAEEGNDR